MIRRKSEDPEFIKNYFDSYPFSKIYSFRAESLSTESKGTPIVVMN